MSWFPDTSLNSDPKAGTEAFEGVVLVRRQVLLLSLGTLVALGMGGPQRSLARSWGRHREELAWDDLLKQTAPMADELVHSANPDEEAYLARLARLLPQVSDVPPFSLSLP